MLSEERRTDHEGALTEPASSRLVSPDIRDEFGLETIDMNMGPQHPAMHGLLRLILELDGETVVRCDPVMGYLHRCQEKIAENRMYPAVIPLTDRLDYFANMHNEHGYVLAVEDLLDVEIPPRAEYIRVLMCELMRLASHIPSIGFLMLELGAFTPILYAFRERERIQTIFEAVTGAQDDVPLHPHRGRQGRPSAGYTAEDLGLPREPRGPLPAGLRRPYRGERDLHLPHPQRREDDPGAGRRDGRDRTSPALHGR